MATPLPIDQIVKSIDSKVLQNVAAKIAELSAAFAAGNNKTWFQTGTTYFIEDYLAKHLKECFTGWAQRNVSNASELQLQGLYKYVFRYVISKELIPQLRLCNNARDVIYE